MNMQSANKARTARTKMSAALAATVLGVLGLAACSPAGEGGSSGGAQMFTVVVDGSSTVYPISEAAGEAYQRDQAGRVRVTVAESGTGGGFRKFCRNETHVQGASRPILAAEIEACRAAGVTFIELPIAFDALSVVVHPDNPLKDITVDDLKKIWAPEAQGKINNWRQVNPAFPEMSLTLFGPGTASGTFDYFTEAVVGEAKSSRSDYTPSEDDNVLVQGLSSDKGGLGYFGMSYYTVNKTRVRALGVSYKGGAPVYPTAETVQSGAYQPLSRPLFGVGEPGIAHHLPIDQLLLAERQWPQRLREEGGHLHLHGGFAGLRTHHRPPHANPVAEVPGIELGPGRFADLIAPEVQLDAPVHVRQMGERRLALAAPRGEAARHRDIGSLIRCAKRGHRFRGRMRAVERVGERFGTRRAQHLELVATRLHQEIQIFAHSGRPSAFSSLSCFR